MVKIVNGLKLKMEDIKDVVHIKIIVLVKNVQKKKIKNVKMFKELELLEKELVNGEKEKTNCKERKCCSVFY